MKIVAVTSCPTGIAHTYMAAEALEGAGRDAGHEITVETQGSAGATPIDPETIAAADAVVFAADVEVRDRLGHALTAEIWWLHRFPLDAAGAIDREAVFNEIRGADAVVQPLSTELEKRLGAIWKDVLGLDALGANQRFFDLGGTSLLSVR